MSLKVSLDIKKKIIICELSSDNNTIVETLTSKEARNAAHLLNELAKMLEQDDHPTTIR